MFVGIPPEVFIKVNVDDPSFGNPKNASSGGLSRNNKGNWIHDFFWDKLNLWFFYILRQIFYSIDKIVRKKSQPATPLKHNTIYATV